MSIITPTQSREARRECGLSQADVAGAISVNRVYVSDFESGNLVRLTNAQLRKLRAFYESKVGEARANGDEIEITFGDAEPEALAIQVETVSARQCTFPVGRDVSKEVVSATLATISKIDRELAGLLNAVTERETAFFGQGEFTEETLAAFREAFSLLACNYLLIRAVGGWPEIGLSAANMNIAENSVLSKVVGEVEKYFKLAGLIEAQAQETDSKDEVEA